MPAKREIPQIFISPARPQTKRDYAEEIKEQDSGIDCQPSVHVGAYLATDGVVSEVEAMKTDLHRNEISIS